MLERLAVRGLGIIDSVELELDAGFAVLTGETGAGKSLLVESLKLLGGQRSQSDMVRSGDDRLRIEAWLSAPRDPAVRALLDELGVSADDSLVLRRELTAAGRSRCWINEAPVTAAALQRLAPHLLAIHGQHEQHGLADTAQQRRLVDDFGEHDELLAATRAAYEGWCTAAAELERLRQARDSRRDRHDAISFQLGEIRAADPQPGEDEALVARRQLLRHAVRLQELSGAVLGRLVDDEAAVVNALARSERELEEMVEVGLPVAEALRRLVESRVNAEEVAREVRQLVAGVEQDPAELEAVESRLHRLEQLMLKYGSPISEVIAHRDTLEQERAELAGVEDRLEAAAAAADKALADFDTAARALDRARRSAGDGLVTEVVQVLGRLNMGGSRLEFRWRPTAEASSPLERDGIAVAFGSDGVEECELLIAANPGEEPRPMARIASGGELSRLHLALRTVLLGRRGSSGLTLLFDEVDSGLGGATAAALADLLADLAAEHQVLVVTHLPQVAAGAASHFRVEKTLVDGRAVTRAARLDPDQREEELARMLAGGELTSSARAHARSLLGDG